MVISLVGLIVLILDIWAIFQVAASGYTPGKKALWVIFIILFPVLGMLIWLLFGAGRL